MRLRIVIDNLTCAQAIALEDMLAAWEWLGSIGASRWTAFYADGDGNFRPKITVDGSRPRFTPLLIDAERWKGDEYRIDFDTIAARAGGASPEQK